MDIITIVIIFASLFGAILFGAAFVWAAYYIYDYYRFKKIKKNVPTDRAQLSNPCNDDIDIKEVRKNGGIDIDKVRQFEKLRRIAEGKRVIDAGESSPTGDHRESERGSIQDKITLISEAINKGDSKSELEPKQDIRKSVHLD